MHTQTHTHTHTPIHTCVCYTHVCVYIHAHCHAHYFQARGWKMRWGMRSGREGEEAHTRQTLHACVDTRPCSCYHDTEHTNHTVLLCPKPGMNCGDSMLTPRWHCWRPGLGQEPNRRVLLLLLAVSVSPGTTCFLGFIHFRVCLVGGPVHCGECKLPYPGAPCLPDKGAWVLTHMALLWPAVV